MSSLLSKCEGCGTTIADGHPCTECKPVAQIEGIPTCATAEEYFQRRKVHELNFKIGMLLRMGTGLLGLLTAVMWFLVIYQGSVGAFVLVGVLTVASGILGWVTLGADKYFPVALQCPGCETRLDEVGSTRIDNCPSCGCNLS